MAPLIKKYKAAAVNAEPGWLDLELSVEKTIHWINEAGKNGCKLIAFPELWIPGLVPENPLTTLLFEKKLLATSVCTHSEEHQADV
jgi:predicted amidohydrolase